MTGDVPLSCVWWSCDALTVYLGGVSTGATDYSVGFSDCWFFVRFHLESSTSKYIPCGLVIEKLGFDVPPLSRPARTTYWTLSLTDSEPATWVSSRLSGPTLLTCSLWPLSDLSSEGLVSLSSSRGIRFVLVASLLVACVL